MTIFRLTVWLVLIALTCCQHVASKECSGIQAVIDAHKTNATALKTLYAPPWVAASEFRGTMAILQTCIVTLVACIYTALHLNVPTTASRWVVLRTKATWVCLALFAPELVLYMAADQFFQALRLSGTLKRLQSEKGMADEKKMSSDLAFSFFVIMGGVQVEIAKLAEFLSTEDLDPEWTVLAQYSNISTSPNPQEAIQLTPQGVIQLARSGHWIHVRGAKIEDKSKANTLQKGLVLLQILYMVVTCIARLIFGLPITLLEIHTIVHVICATALYVFWLKKPLDIHEPELVYEPEWAPTLGVMAQKTFYRRQAEKLVRYEIPPRQAPCEDRTQEDDGSSLSKSTPAVLPLSNFDNQTDRKLDKDCMTEKGLSFRGYDDPPWTRLKPPLRPQALARLNAVADDLDGIDEENDEDDDEYPIHDPMNLALKRPLEVSCFSKTQNLHSLTVTNFSPKSIPFRDSALLLGLLIILPAVYGGVHLSAWNSRFPTHIEQLLWRITCLIIAATMPTTILVFFITKWIEDLVTKVRPFRRGLNRLSAWLSRNPEQEFADLSVTMFLYGLIVPLMAFAFARVFIVVESFISLRRIPIGAYWTPSWLEMIPHA